MLTGLDHVVGQTPPLAALRLVAGAAAGHGLCCWLVYSFPLPLLGALEPRSTTTRRRRRCSRRRRLLWTGHHLLSPRRRGRRSSVPHIRQANTTRGHGPVAVVAHGRSPGGVRGAHRARTRRSPRRSSSPLRKRSRPRPRLHFLSLARTTSRSAHATRGHGSRAGRALLANSLDAGDSKVAVNS